MAKHIKTDEEVFAPWEELYGRSLQEGERREISNNLAEFFAILHEWKQEEIRNNAKGGNPHAKEKSPNA
jgi:hypothetical protein